MKRFLLLTILLTVVMTSCDAVDPGKVVGPPSPLDGQIIATQMGQMVYGIQQALLEKWGTQMLIHEGNQWISFVWARNNAYYLVGIDLKNLKSINDLTKLGGANLMNRATLRDLTNYMESNGWRYITLAEVPHAFKATISAMPTLLAQYAASWYTFILPVFPISDGEQLNLIDFGDWEMPYDEFWKLILAKPEWY